MTHCAVCALRIRGRALVVVEDVDAIRPFSRYHHPGCLPREPDYWDTWEGVAQALGRSSRWCRDRRRRAADPLPLQWVGGVVRIYRRDRDAWIARQTASSRRAK